MEGWLGLDTQQRQPRCGAFDSAGGDGRRRLRGWAHTWPQMEAMKATTLASDLGEGRPSAEDLNEGRPLLPDGEKDLEVISFLAMADLEAGTSRYAARASGVKYQVFLSFRGLDTRYGFTDFLFHGLVDAGVHVFRDDNELRVGEEIGENIRRAIDNSMIYIPIFSQTYASSKWCLLELARMVNNATQSEGEKSILPIFLDVEPEDVKLKTPRYRDALLEHEKKFPGEVKAWRNALAEVDEIKGWNVKKDQSQAEVVKLVVKMVLEILKLKQKSVTEKLVGLEGRVQHLRELLDVNHRDVRLIRIYGMGGIGKTTIAKVVFNELSSHFGKCCSFLENVRESMLTKDGMVQLQKKLLSDIVNSESAEKVNDAEEGERRIGETLDTKKVLVVLDDVDNNEHIKKLIGNNPLHSGSRVIITMRNETIPQESGFKGEIMSYEMLKMDNALALQLFCRHAFGGDVPLEDYQGLSSEIVSSTGGLPLAVEVIGSLLNQKDKGFWEETLARLRDVPEQEILNKLRISYDDLDEYQRQIFLDVACFFFNEKKTEAIYMWTDCKFYPKRGIDALCNKCLIKISEDDKFWMHDQLINMGRQIVREESRTDLVEQSRLWIANEALEVIRTEERKEKVQALEINGRTGIIEITNEEFERLQNLRFLKLRNGTFIGDFAKCRSKLKWLSWQPHGDFRVDNMHLDHLVVFKLGKNFFRDDSKAWDLIKRAHNLKVLSLTKCHGITTIPDFSKCLRLESLTLAHCSNLKRIESFIGELQSLIELEINECNDLIDLPEEVGALVKLKRLSLQRCCSLSKLPGSLENLISLTELDLSYTMIRELSNSIGKLKSLRVLHLPQYRLFSLEHRVWRLPSSIGMLENLEVLDLYGHKELGGEIPAEIGELSSLRILDLECTGISRIPRTISRLHQLQELDLWDCDSIQVLPELPTSLTCLRLKCTSLLSVPDLSNLTNLVKLQLDHGSWDTRKSKLGLPNVPAPPELASLSSLKELRLSRIDLETLGQLPSSLLRLDLQDSRIRWAELLPLTNLSTLELQWCEVEDIPLDGFQPLETLTVHACIGFRRLSIPSELRKLRRLDVSYCKELVEIQVVGLLKSLEYLSIRSCHSLIRISGLSYLKNLETLRISFCKVLPNVEGLNELKSLKSLEVSYCESLRRLIDASRTKVPGHCVVTIKGGGHSIEDTRTTLPLKRYLEEILLDTKKRPFTITFHLGGKEPTWLLESSMVIKRVKEHVTPDSVTYKGLIADVKGFGLRLKRMWYWTDGAYRGWPMEIKSDEQVKEMVQVASERGSIHLSIEVGADSEWEGEYDGEMMEMLWPMKTDVYSVQNGDEGDVSNHDEDSVYASKVESETNGTSSIDDFQSEPSEADSFDATGKRSRGSSSRRGTTNMGASSSSRKGLAQVLDIAGL